MPGAFSGIEMTSRALRAFQRALDVTGNNIANVNTSGYNRQVVDFAESTPITYWENGMRSMGTGVMVSSINQVRDAFLQSRVQSAMSSGNQFGTVASGLKEISGIFNEPSDQGISNALGKFFDSWTALGSNPTDSAARMQVQSAGKTLASRVRQTYAALSDATANTGNEITASLNQINDIAKQISNLNEQARQSLASGGSLSGVTDERDRLIGQLSELTNASVINNPDGTVSVNLSEFNLVDSAGAHDLPTNFDAATSTLVGWVSPIHVRSGKLAGLLSNSVNQTAARTMLDNLANSLRTQINALHTAGTNPNGTTGILFFNDVAVGNPQTGAIDFDLSAAVASDINNIAAGTSNPYKAGDGGLAQSIGKFRTSAIAALGSRSFEDFYKQYVTGIGTQSESFNQQADVQSAILKQVDSQIQAISGVNMDEEMANMLRFQRSYQAAAKALTIFDQTTDDLINMVRR